MNSQPGPQQCPRVSHAAVYPPYQKLSIRSTGQLACLPMISEIPNPLTHEFIPNRVANGAPCWNDLKIEGKEQMEWSVTGVQIVHCETEYCHWNANALILEKCVVQNWRIYESQVIGPRLIECDLTRLVLDRAIFSYSNIKGTRLACCSAMNATLDSAFFDSCNIESFYIGRRSSVRKLRFRHSRVKMIVDVDTFPIGQVFLDGSEGMLIFSPDSIPSRIYNHGSNVSLVFIVDPIAFWKCKNGKDPSRSGKIERAYEILGQDDLATLAGIKYLELPSGNRINHEDILRTLELEM
jgi:hypothetical protein